MTDHELLQTMISRIGRTPRSRQFDPESGHLIELDLSGCNLAEIPEEVFSFVHLQKLILGQSTRTWGQISLSGNRIQNISPLIGQYSDLKELYVDNNEIVQLPSEIGMLRNLQRLSASNNHLTILPLELSYLSELLFLNVAGNLLRNLPPEIVDLRNLFLLNADRNQLTSILPEIGKLGRLQVLSLADNLLSELPNEIGALHNLITLDVARNQLVSIPSGVEHLERLQELDFGHNHVAEVPREIGKLTTLQKLHLDNNHIATLPGEIGEMIGLHELWLDNNDLTALPAQIGALSNLGLLRLSGNRISGLPKEVGGLSSLTGLWIESNQLTSLVAEIKRLSRLRLLWLSNNRIENFPSEICELTGLRSLNLRQNLLVELPSNFGRLVELQELDLSRNQLAKLPASFANLPILSSLDIRDNPLRTPPLEIAEQGPIAIHSYFARLDPPYLRNEAKLLLVGEGDTGKSSLLRSLAELPFDARLASTHGIDVQSIELLRTYDEGKKLLVHVWDFGGQQIYHTSHQFFMTRRSLYIIVWNSRGDTDQARLDHWLRNIQVLAPDARVLLVATHIDQRPADFNLDRFRAAYPDMIVDFASVSNKTGAGIHDLRRKIAEEGAKLPLMEQEWPRAWVDVETALLALDQTHIDGRTLAEICERCGVTEAYEQQILGGYLHDLGKILFYQDDDVLSDFIVLKPNWLTQATARVLDDAVTRDEHHGVLEHRDFPRIWEGYERKLYPVFVRMLEKFLISYQLEERAHGRRQSLVPLLLPHRPPADLPPWASVLPEQPEVRMVFDLDFVPPGIMSWFIVLTHHYSQDLHWREGVRLHYEGHQADVVLNPSTRQLWLQVRGPAPSNFFNILQHTVNDRIIRKYFEGLTYWRRVPCICHKARGEAAPCPHYFEYDKLVERKQRGKDSIECGESYADVSVTELLEGIHYSTHDRLEQKLDEMRAVVDASHALIVENRQLTEQLVRESMRSWNFITKNAFSDLPSVFVLMPGERRRFDPRSLFSEDHRLYLLCQHPAAPHIVTGEAGYLAPRDREWWRQISPWLHQMAKLLKFVPKLSGVAKAFDESWYKTIELNVELYGVVVQALPDFDERLDRMARHGLAGDPARGTVEAEGTALRALHVWLREVDKPQHWCGLQKVVTNDGNILWLCPEHAAFHGI